ncbi:MAG: hypothetical protein U9N09_08490, partial [Euryarchaeota archaeon]|nr:hypothetical protein [Euryarchaeota archaeon]
MFVCIAVSGSIRRKRSDGFEEIRRCGTRGQEPDCRIGETRKPRVRLQSGGRVRRAADRCCQQDA